MTTMEFKCPGCGASVADDPEKDILTCERCGNTITKAISEYDKSLRYLREKDIRHEATQKEETEYRRKQSKTSGIILGIIVFAGLIFLYLSERGIL